MSRPFIVVAVVWKWRSVQASVHMAGAQTVTNIDRVNWLRYSRVWKVQIGKCKGTRVTVSDHIVRDVSCSFQRLSLPDVSTWHDEH